MTLTKTVQDDLAVWIADKLGFLIVRGTGINICTPYAGQNQYPRTFLDDARTAKTLFRWFESRYSRRLKCNAGDPYPLRPYSRVKYEFMRIVFHDTPAALLVIAEACGFENSLKS